ncbi:MAG: DMT family transporter [Oscillospiraceae bacterium]|nr:DMT family transporter [Oscillospiraceae bacterium]
MKEKLKGSLLLVLATVIWGSAFVAQSAGMDLIGPFTFQTVRCLLAVIALIPVIYLLDGKDSKNFIRKWADKKLWRTGALCGLALFFAQSLQQVGLVYTDAGKAGFITAMYIVIVPILGIFLKRKPTAAAVISIFIAVAGLYLLSCVGVTQINIGDVLMLLCAVAFAVQITIVDRFAGDLDSIRLNCIQALVVTVLSAVFMFFTEKPQIQPIVNCWLPLCYAGVLSMGAAYSLQIVGQKSLEPTTASLIMSLESVFAVLSAWLILNERLTPWELAGCILVFSAVILSQIPFKRKPKA